MEKVKKAIREFHDRVIEFERVIAVLNGVVDMQPESALNTAAWDLIGGYKDALGAAYHIDGWLEWWWLECNLGNNPMKAKLSGGELRTISTLDDFVKLVCDDLAHGD